MLSYLSNDGHPDHLLRAIGHLENCIDATYRAVLNGEALRNNKIGRGAPRLTDKQRECLKAVRDPIEHSSNTPTSGCSKKQIPIETSVSARAAILSVCH